MVSQKYKNRLAKLLTENASTQLEQSAAAQKAAQAADAASKSQADNDKSGTKKQGVQEAIKKTQDAATTLRDSAAQSFQDWRANMFDILNLAVLLNRSINKQVNAGYRQIWDATGKPIWRAILGSHIDALNKMELQSLQEEMTASFEELAKAISLKENGQLEVADIEKFESFEDKDKIKKILKEGAELWLKDLGYEYDADSNKFVNNETNRPLNQIDFRSMHSGSVRSLSNWFNGCFQPEVEAQSSPGPSPR